MVRGKRGECGSDSWYNSGSDVKGGNDEKVGGGGIQKWFVVSSLVRWAEGNQLAIAPQKSSVTLFTSDTNQTRLHS